ncbi:hypothetical protein TEA_023432 [Camellia sinensis var. sinensis]|uniref:Uncharacterized protein n=1 Tax=Camellia sinensis var. sinensis TaxID=542762 RepID=A0A4S4CWQ6_CAMSN|nr:hypothetical protein TEA_023432 [Camellia sinensis var. sinensis]
MVIENHRDLKGDTYGNIINIRTIYLLEIQGNVKWAFTSLIYHEMTQWFGGLDKALTGLIEGIADFTILKADYYLLGFVNPRWTSEENEDRTLALVKAIEKALQVSDKDPKSKIKGKAKSGAEYLASRSYHGLDIQSNNSLMIHSLVSILFILCSVEDLEAAAKLYISYWIAMAYPSLLHCCLIALAALQSIAAVQFDVDNIDKATPGGVRFTNEIGVEKDYQRVLMVIENYQGAEAVGYDNTINVSVWSRNGQAPGGLTEGIADYTVFKANYQAPDYVEPGIGNRWDEGYGVTTRFFGYCDSIRLGFVVMQNKKMRHAFSLNYFVELLGKAVDQLWSEYKAKYNSGGVVSYGSEHTNVGGGVVSNGNEHTNVSSSIRISLSTIRFVIQFIIFEKSVRIF